MSLPSTLKWQSVVQRQVVPDAQGDATFQDPFDSFFGSSMGNGQDLMQQMQRRMQQMMRQAESGFDVGAVQQKDLVLRSSDVALEVAALPTEGRPAGTSIASRRPASPTPATGRHIRRAPSRSTTAPRCSRNRSLPRMRASVRSPPWRSATSTRTTRAT
jgi:hypothetical protein